MSFKVLYASENRYFSASLKRELAEADLVAECSGFWLDRVAGGMWELLLTVCLRVRICATGSVDAKGMRQRHVENAISEQVLRFQLEIMGRGPEELHTFIFRDMVVVRMKGTLTKEETHLAKTDNGRRLVKQMRRILRETFSAEMEEMVTRETGLKVISSHSDISTKTGERIEIFILEREFVERDFSG